MPALADLLATSRSALDRLRDPQAQGPSPAMPVLPSAGGGVSGALDSLLSPYKRAISGAPTNMKNPFGEGLEWVLGRAAKTLMSQGVPTTSAALTAGGLETRRGATLTPAAMAALVQAAREYSQVKGTRELGMFGPLSTYRTYAEQAALGGTAQNPGGSNPNATTAGSSLHEEGLAIDVPAQLQTPQFFDLLRSLGWNQLEGEPWHWTYKAYG